jgi:hypothetical protein
MKKKLLLYAGIVVGLLILSYAYVPQVLSGKIVNQSDISGWQGMSHEMMSWNAAHPDDQTAWTESMFGGMPTGHLPVHLAAGCLAADARPRNPPAHRGRRRHRRDLLFL